MAVVSSNWDQMWWFTACYEEIFMNGTNKLTTISFFFLFSRFLTTSGSCAQVAFELDDLDNWVLDFYSFTEDSVRLQLDELPRRRFIFLYENHQYEHF